MTVFAGETIWIIGASCGIGAALARELAREGATLILSARTTDALEALRAELGDAHRIYPLDVSDAQAVQQAVDAIADSVVRIDRVIFMAAIYRQQDIDQMDMAFAKSLVEVNLLGAIYVSYAILPVFTRQGRGQIALCGSVAGYTGLPGGQPYSASKAGIINFAESLYAEAGDGIDVKLINPGFVRTRITDKNSFHMPMRIEPEQAAKAIAKGLRRKSFEIHFPKAFTCLVKLLRLLPYPMMLYVTRRLRGQSDNSQTG